MMPDEKLAYARSFRVHVGVDTGKKFHVLVARGPDGRRTPPHKVLVSRAGFETADLHLCTGGPTSTCSAPAYSTPRENEPLIESVRATRRFTRSAGEPWLGAT